MMFAFKLQSTLTTALVLALTPLAASAADPVRFAKGDLVMVTTGTYLNQGEKVDLPP